jgi:hypothetical protein
MNPFDPAEWMVGGLIAISAVVGMTIWTAHVESQGYQHAKAEFTEQAFKATTEARKREADLQTSADTIRKDKDDAIQTLRVAYAADLERLRQRPDRPSTPGLPATASDGAPEPGCTGAQLYRPDAEFSLGESVRAETIRTELKACYAQYDRARAEVNRE